MSQLRISAWAIRNPTPISLLFLALMLAGTISYFMLPVKQFPNIEFPMVVVTVVQSGAAPGELENQVTRPVEDAIAGLSDVKSVVSTVVQGASTTMVEFEMNTDLQKAKDDVQSKVDQVRNELPREVEPPIVQGWEMDDTPIITYAVAAPQMSDEELSWFIDNTLSRRLQGLKGVAAISRVGGVDREINVILDPVRMAAQGVTAPQVSSVLAQVSSDAAGGRVAVGGREQLVRVLGAAATVDQVRNLTIPVGARFVRVGDVADVGDGTSEVRNFARLNGVPVVGFEVKKTRDASDVDVEKRIDAALEQMFNPKPKAKGEKVAAEFPGVSVNKIFSRVYETRNSFEATKHTMLEGMALAALVVFLFLRDWRATAVTALAMPASLVPTFAVMSLMGFSLNIITLLALTLVIGILVDDAIVEIENIEKRIHRGMRPYDAAIEGADQIGLAVVATTFAILAVFMPVSFMPGIPGQFFKEFGLTVSVAVLFSLVVARLLTPLLAAYFLKPKPAQPRKPLPRAYTRSLDWALDHRILSCIAGVVIFALSIVLFAILPKGLNPESNPDFHAINVEAPVGSTLDDTARAAQAVADIVAARPETTGVFVQVGTGAVDQNSGSSPTGANRALVTAIIKPHNQRPSVPEIREKMRDQLFAVPDARVNFAGEGFGGGGVQVILTSDSGDALDQAGLALQQQMKTLPMLGDPRFATAPSGPEIVIRPKPEEAARLGVTAQTIAQIARVATVGDIDANVAKLTAGERRVPIRVRLPADVRSDLSALRATLIPTASGGVTTLDTVADIYFQAGPAQIDRFDRKRQVTVKADLIGGAQLGDAMAKINQLPIMKNLPAGVAPASAGEQQAYMELIIGFVIALLSGILLVYGVMVLLFRSFFKPITIMMSLPLALGGAFLGLLVGGILMGHPKGMAVDMPSFIGFLMLMGLASKNAILLVEYAIEREREGHPQREAILEACRERARPIVMTTLAMMAGMLPTALGLGAGSEFRQPMAVAVIGGLITSTALSLVLVPVIYEIVDSFENWVKPKLGRLVTPREAETKGLGNPSV
jgi:HAE1 family hydrophobic/amphiphilic exporter-1